MDDFTACLVGVGVLPSFQNAALVLVGVLCGIFIARGAPLLLEKVPKGLFRGGDASTRTVPKHIAVIMDGNRRFGKLKRGDPLKGHWAGGQTLLDFVQWCKNDGVELVSVYAFSTENWSRDAVEINLLMTLFGKYAETMAEEAKRRNVKVKILSTDYNRLPQRVIRSVENLEEATKYCDGLLLNVCLSYGARAEITAACSSLVEDILLGKLRVDGISVDPTTSRSTSEEGGVCGSISDGKLEGGVEESKGENREPKKAASVVDGDHNEDKNTAREKKSHVHVLVEKEKIEITEEMLGSRLLTKQLPDPDLLIRTSGEVRISNFLLYQLAYTEMFFVDKLWPEFSQEDFKGVLRQFSDRKRRFGT